MCIYRSRFSRYGPLLQMMDVCIKEDRLQRVKDVAKLLKPPKMHVMAVKLANKAHRTILAEQLQAIFDSMQVRFVSLRSQNPYLDSHTIQDDAAESSDNEIEDRYQYRSHSNAQVGSAARRQQQDERKAASDASEHEDSAPESDHDRHAGTSLDTLCIENLVIESPKAEYWPWMEQKLGSALPREGMQSAHVPLLYLPSPSALISRYTSQKFL